MLDVVNAGWYGLCDIWFDVMFDDVVFFVKQKTAYEMRISDWSSDVCSSDLNHLGKQGAAIGDACARRFRHGRSGPGAGAAETGRVPPGGAAGAPAERRRRAGERRSVPSALGRRPPDLARWNARAVHGAICRSHRYALYPHLEAR